MLSNCQLSIPSDTWVFLNAVSRMHGSVTFAAQNLEGDLVRNLEVL